MTPRPPEALQLVVENIPEDLLAFNHWNPWRWKLRDGKWTKVLIDAATGAYASSTDPRTWSPFEEAVRYARKKLLPGVGFVFTNSPFAGVDLDGCRDPETGRLEDWAREIVAGLESYTEGSPSGTGVKALVRGSLPPGRRRKGSVEMYDTARYFAVTGHRLPGVPAGIMERTEQLAALHRSVFSEPVAPSNSSNRRGDHESRAQSLSDGELVERAMRAANSEKFKRLWAGDTSDYGNGDNEGRSEADLALCSLLAFWCGPNEARIDALFRQSGLYRAKWERADYRALTLCLAVDRKEFWSPGKAKKRRGKVYARRKGAVSVG